MGQQATSISILAVGILAGATVGVAAQDDALRESCDQLFARYEWLAAQSDVDRLDATGTDRRGLLEIDTESEDLAGCLEPGETVIAIEGLPGASGLYRSRDRQMELRGFGELIGNIPDVYFGRCFVGAKGQPFQSNAVISAVMNPDLDGVDLAITVDMGISAGHGDPALTTTIRRHHRSRAG